MFIAEYFRRLLYLKQIWLIIIPLLNIIVCTPNVSANISPLSIIIDDYSPTSTYRNWYYSRIGTDRGEMGADNYNVIIGGGTASVNVTTGWAGVWTNLMHLGGDTLNPTQLLGPYVKQEYQAQIVGVEIDVLDGSGTLKLELTNQNGTPIHTNLFSLTGGQQTLNYQVTPTEPLKSLNWLVDGTGHVTVDEIRLLINTPDHQTKEAIFLFSYSHLSQCYDDATGLVRDRARWPVEDSAAVQSIGMFALVTAVAYDLGFVEENIAKAIVNKTTERLGLLPTYKGLLPHFLKNGDIVPNTEWSSVDTVISLVANILAAQSLNIDTSSLESMLSNIDWNDLSNGYTSGISMGYDYSKVKITNTWDTFGSETFLLAVAYSAATSGKIAIIEQYPNKPTWDGSGFNDEMATLFFPMTGRDYWGNDWNSYRCSAFKKQYDYFINNNTYSEPGLFGLSASEVPEKWAVANDADHYAAWGVGGHNGAAHDGTTVAGYPIVAPHYAALTCTEQSASCEIFFEYIASKNIFTPLNNVESCGVAGSELKWSSLKGSWNLVLQALGVGRALSGDNFVSHLSLKQNNFLFNGYSSLFKEFGKPCSFVITPVLNLLLNSNE
ncbi:MAG: hypothetical protein KAR45_16365 [Desulfobacteraceae bacterium]|nr:hypothetical protein [Desulfobacteraceae bacterium]